jgi:glycosyltransferase involved in cell wall biosynthesis
MRVLFISPYIPTPIRTRPYNFIRALARRGHEITLLALRVSGDPEAPPEEIVRACRRWEALPLPRSQVVRNMLWALPRDYPLQAAYSRSPQMARLIQEVVRANGLHPASILGPQSSYNIVHVEHLRGASLASAVEGTPRIYDAVDCISLLFERAWRHAPSWRHRLMVGVDLARTRRFEGRIVAEMDGVLVSSPEDRSALAALAAPHLAGRINVVPNGVDLDYFRPSDETDSTTQTVVFSGKMSYHANIAAALDLAQTIMPRVWQAAPHVRLIIAGKDPPPTLKVLERDRRISVTGGVPDLRPIIASAAVVACPLRYGAGIQNKVLEAMALARPVVIGAQAKSALRAEPGRDLLVGSDPQEFAGHMLGLLNDPALRRSIGQAGRRYVEAHHDWDMIAGQLEALYRAASA